MRLLSGVNTRVYSEGRTLDELLSTAWVVANVRTNSAVNALCMSVSCEATDNRQTTYRVWRDRSCEQTPCHK